MQCIVTCTSVPMRIYLKSVLRYTSTCLIFYTYHPNLLYLREYGCEDQCLFFEAKMDPWTKKCGKHWLKETSWNFLYYSYLCVDALHFIYSIRQNTTIVIWFIH